MFCVETTLRKNLTAALLRRVARTRSKWRGDLIQFYVPIVTKIVVDDVSYNKKAPIREPFCVSLLVID